MKISIEVFKLQELLSGFSYFGTLSSKKRSAIATISNIKIISEELFTIQGIQNSMYSDEDITKYDALRVSTCKRYCVKDELGNPILNNGQYLFETREAFEGASSALVALDTEFPSGAEKKEEADKSNEDLLNSTIEVELHEVFLSDISEQQALIPARLQSVFYLLKE